MSVFSARMPKLLAAAIPAAVELAVAVILFCNWLFEEGFSVCEIA
jgi:hypothetical protein